MNEHHFHVYIQTRGRRYQGGCASNWASVLALTQAMGGVTGIPDHPPSLPVPVDEERKWHADGARRSISTLGVLQADGQLRRLHL